MKSTSMVLTCLALAGCGADPLLNGDTPVPDEPAPVRAAVGDTVRLTPGGSAHLGDAGLRISFEGITADSRCPRGVECVWSGDAVARLALASAGTGVTTVELHTHLEPRTAMRGAYAIELLAVEPYPEHGRPVRREDYVAVLRVIDP